MNRNKFRYILIVLFAILIIIEFAMLDYSNLFSWKSLFRIVSPALMIIAMVLSINHVKQHGEN